MRVVVIGNSHDLLHRDDGEKIDACDRIIRINSFRLDGHARQVGSRIDIVCICISRGLVETALVHSADLISQAKEIWTPSWRGQATAEDVAFAMAAVKRRPEELIFSDDTDHKNVITSLYGLVYETAERRAGPKTQAKDGQRFRPTTGFQTIHLAEARFPSAELFITGFGLNSPLDLRRFDTSGVGIWPGHDIPAERELLLRGAEEGRWKKL
jgi:hypothetical protein